MVVIDIWYSSTENKHLDKVKYLFSSAIKRDIYAKTLVEWNWGKVINANAEPSDNNEGFLFHSEAINNLLKIWAQNYVNT